jgi:N-dimethylarginine dimethylaminohydrolase
MTRTPGDRTVPERYTSNAAFVQGRVPFATRDFSDPAELREVWGQEWGASTDVGQLRHVLLRRPGPEFDAVDLELWDDELGAAFDPDGRWYWCERRAPDLPRMQQQHDHLVATLQGYGVQTDVLDPLPGLYTKSVYMRDPLVTVKGGAIIGRLAAQMRRGEEAFVSRTVAEIGLPILGTISGSGVVEGGSYAKITPTVALFGTSIRCNDAGAAQLADILRYHGVTLISVPLSGFEFHLDGTLSMIDVDRALLSPETGPHWLPDLLREHGITPIWVPPTEGYGVNGLTIAPGHVIMSSSAPRTAEMLDRIGVRVDVIDYDAIEGNGGGIHCSTMELRRDDV